LHKFFGRAVNLSIPLPLSKFKKRFLEVLTEYSTMRKLQEVAVL